ncbi:MAG: FecR family protein [Pseudomonas sp.]|uniref:FecR family protein n=1 Tax=Pseudomonas sp. TaxID=306 RepID=UPI001202AE0D|nr:FecR family protein [Pseudomonas sp.]RZI76818.1 MAG: FecR family protein [Pseudomonas sp.]
MRAMPPDATDPLAIPTFEHLQQAADWFALLQGGACKSERLQWQRWLDTGPGHRAAWQRVEAVAGEFATLAGLPTRQVLERGSIDAQRRITLRALAIVPMAGLAGWLAFREMPWRSWTAAYRTGIGERREIVLADGSHLWLNTTSAVDVDFSSSLRRIVLHKGEVMITSGHDKAFAARSLVVDVSQGRLTALGTRFGVRHEKGEATRLAVFEGRVEARPSSGSDARTLVAGQQAQLFTNRVDGIGGLTSAGGGASYADDWTRGMLVADGLRLGDFLAELGRYRPGYLGCAPDVADLRIVGAYPLADIDRILDALQTTLPVKVHHPMPWWTVVAAGSKLVRR